MSALPAPQLYGKYGDPFRLVEFRLFSFNECGGGCAHCYYRKTDNRVERYDDVLALATDLRANGFQLETCYLLPTDVFENDFNYDIFRDEKLRESLRSFRYVGLASTLREGYDARFLDSFFADFPGQGIELHVNLIEARLEDPAYESFLLAQLRELRTRYAGRIQINLALNTGAKHSERELGTLAGFAERGSDDRILELNFTYLFNAKLPKATRRDLLRGSFPLVRFLRAEMSRREPALTERTLLRKPSFVFKDGRIFLTPILPFDEYLFVDDPAFTLSAPSFDAYLSTYARLQAENLPVDDDCENCPELRHCQGKGYFMAAHHYGLGCHHKES